MPDGKRRRACASSPRQQRNRRRGTVNHSSTRPTLELSAPARLFVCTVESDLPARLLPAGISQGSTALSPER